nr:hypothetical protein CFP56_53311 [Quercus suber]
MVEAAATTAIASHASMISRHIKHPGLRHIAVLRPSIHSHDRPLFNAQTACANAILPVPDGITFHPSTSLIAKSFLLIKQIRPRTAQIDDLRTPVPIFLQPRALEAVESVGDAVAAADHAFVLIVAETAFVADAYLRRRAHIRIADGAFAVAFVAESSERDARGFAAHDQITE